jgi:hypothetical protein
MSGVVFAFLVVMRQPLFGRRDLGDNLIGSVFIAVLVVYSAPWDYPEIIRLRHSISHVSILPSHAHQSYQTLSVSGVDLGSPVLAVIHELSLAAAPQA